MGSLTSGLSFIGESLDETDDALQKLFGKILNTLANTDVFSRSTSPSNFIVYTHDSPEKGTANAKCVDLFIQWLKILRSRTLSDRSPVLLWSRREGEDAAIENILSNQFCLLPAGCRVDDAGTIISVDKVIVCGSSLLRRYYEDAFASQYVHAILALYDKFQRNSRDELQRETRDLVEKQCKREWFHHVLTELAFVELRRSQNDGNHGIIPISLDEDGLEYLPFLQNCDHYLKLKSTFKLFDLHKFFFNLLQRIYTEEHERIAIFRDCYKEASKRLQHKMPTDVQVIIDEEISKAQDRWLQLQIAATRERGSDPRVVLSHLNNTARDSKRSNFLRTLSTLPYQDRKDRNPERIDGTCEWFTSHGLFRLWKDCKKSRMLLVSADPGCGKSVLARYLVDNLLSTADRRTICYFFFKDDFEDQKRLQGALRCLLHQLFLQRPTLLSDKILEKFEEDGQLFNSFTGLWNILISVAGSKDAGEIICILDALDECEETGRSELIRALSKLYSNEDNACCLKFLLTSRPYLSIQHGFQTLEDRQPNIHLSGENPAEADQIAHEIDIVIRARVKELGARLKLQDEEEQTLRDKLISFSNRTYLWVYLIFDVISNSVEITKDHLQENVRNLPRTVEAAYENILNRSSNVSKATRLLHIVVAARRPLHLEEMAIALAIRENHQYQRQLDLEPEDRFRKTVRALCGLFVTIIDSKIYLLHQTAREFLIQGTYSEAQSPHCGINLSWRWQNSLCRMESNYILAEICIWYFGLEESDETLFDYATMHWAAHFREAQGLTTKKLAPLAERLCDPKSPRCYDWFRDYRNRTASFRWNDEEERLFLKGITALIVASYSGLDEIVRLLLNQKLDLNARDRRYGRSALSWASGNGYEKTVAILLSQVPPANGLFKRSAVKNIINSRDSWGWTPLWHAANNGHKNVVESLSKKGAKVDCKDIWGTTALLAAARNGHQTVVQLLLDKGAKLDCKDRGGITALSAAARDGHQTVVQLLLDKGAKVDAMDIYHSTPLKYAVHRGDKTIVQSLLDAGANTEAKDDHRWTPLMFAIRAGNTDIIELLLSKGANTEAKDRYHQRPLLLAAECGNIEAAKLLLSKGANIKAVNEWGQSTEWTNAMRQLLLDNGAEI